jgi:putative peptidoglycan lipid II flippase
MLRRVFGRASGNPLIRGGITIGLGIVIGNIVGFVRVAVTAFLLGTHARADALAVAIGPIDTLNSVLINTMLFAFVPMLMLREGPERIALFRRASSVFVVIFASLSALMVVCAPLLIHVLGPGLAHDQVPVAVNILRITALSSLAAGGIAMNSALLFTERRFGPSALYQAALNVFTIAGAFSLWRPLGIYGFAIGYTVGAFVHFAFVWFSARETARRPGLAHFETPWRELIAKPGSFCIYAVLLALNVIVTRAHATNAGPGMAAAFDYCMRCLNVVVAYLVSPISNSLLPEIARLKAENKIRDAWRIIDRTTALAGAAAIACCVVGILLRQPVIALLFERGSFTPESTRLVSGVFLGFAPSMVGWSLLELTSRSLFALNRPWLPMCAAALPVLLNILLSSMLRAWHMTEPEYIGLGASFGLLAAFGALFAVAHMHRRAQAHNGIGRPEEQFVSHT